MRKGGYRLDDTKGLAVEFVSHLLGNKSMASRFAVGEYYDGNPDDLDWWVWNSGMNRPQLHVRFRGLRFTLQAMCNNGSRWDMSQLDHAGYAGRYAMHAVTFVEDHDTDLSSPVVFNAKRLVMRDSLGLQRAIRAFITKTTRRTPDATG